MPVLFRLESADARELPVYPVPVHDIPHIQNSAAIKMTHISSKTVLQKNTAGHAQCLHLGHLPQGIYLLCIETEKGEVFRKIIRQ